MTNNYIITGTDTDVGKTVVAAMLALGLGARYWKPVQSGRDAETGRTDTETVRALAGLDGARCLRETYCFSQALSPHRAAELDGITIEPEKIISDYKRHASISSPLLIEGAGGLMVPITRGLLQIDLFAQIGAPVILVARTGLGTINHTLLSLGVIRARGLVLAGIIFTGPENSDNIKTILDFAARERMPAQNLGWLPPLAELNASALMAAFHEHIKL